MQLISAHDDQLYGLAYTATKLGKADELLAWCEQARRDDPSDVGAACRQALVLMATFSSVGASFEAHARFTFAIDAFEEVLAAAPDHWLARYCLARLRALIPSGYGTAQTSGTNLLTEARDGLQELIKRQAEVAYQPYFASAFALAAVTDQLAGDDDPERWAARLAGVAAAPRVRVALPHLSAVLCEPLITLHAEHGGPERDTLGEVMSALYGHHPAVAAAMRSVPTR